MNDEPEMMNPEVSDLETPKLQKAPTPERWAELCRQAAVERDPKKLVATCDRD